MQLPQECFEGPLVSGSWEAGPRPDILLQCGREGPRELHVNQPLGHSGAHGFENSCNRGSSHLLPLLAMHRQPPLLPQRQQS